MHSLEHPEKVAEEIRFDSNELSSNILLSSPIQVATGLWSSCKHVELKQIESS
jgi:hypothetical protein